MVISEHHESKHSAKVGWVGRAPAGLTGWHIGRPRAKAFFQAYIEMNPKPAPKFRGSGQVERFATDGFPQPHATTGLETFASHQNLESGWFNERRLRGDPTWLIRKQSFAFQRARGADSIRSRPREKRCVGIPPIRVREHPLICPVMERHRALDSIWAARRVLLGALGRLVCNG
ncbi:hypothetical protein RE6C_05673 [Rhodopirellula europaea 6C]|uniref:Uncharacterized protein n=1 Tax=Rhodopirellula europaea 6C TaxID=1263867 RepID=M2AVN5_9BACT|nr:hypothetical protein RE6C_05673 [Rhodopirellula europaea 6C]